MKRTGLYRTRSGLVGQSRNFINHLLDSGPLNLFVLGGKICSVEFGRMWKVCLEMLFKLCGTFLQISVGETGISADLQRWRPDQQQQVWCISPKCWEGIKVLRLDTQISSTCLWCHDVIAGCDCANQIQQTSPVQILQPQYLSEHFCCRWARAPSSSRHPPKKRVHSRLTFVCVFLRGSAPPSSFWFERYLPSSGLF